MFTLFPPNTVPTASTHDSSISAGPSSNPAPVIHITSSLSSGVVQTCTFPFSAGETQPSTTTSPNLAENQILRLPTPSLGSRPYMLVVSTPADKVALTAEGSTIWRFQMQTWAAQVDELVQAGAYHRALTLLDSIDQSLLPDKVRPTPCYSCGVITYSKGATRGSRSQVECCCTVPCRGVRQGNRYLHPVRREPSQNCRTLCASCCRPSRGAFGRLGDLVWRALEYDHTHTLI